MNKPTALMKNPRLLLCALVLISVVMTGCSTTGAFNAATLTNVQLSQANYQIVASNVTGEASSGYLIGVSASIYREMQTFALVRVSGTGRLYGEALENLWENFQAEYGEAEGRNLALVNVRYDTEALNFLLYTRPTVSVRADVVEFIGD